MTPEARGTAGDGNPASRRVTRTAVTDPIVARLREIRLAEGWTQADVAAAMGVTRSQVVNLEAGRGSPTLRRLRRWCNALGVALVVMPVDARTALEPCDQHTLCWGAPNHTPVRL